MIYILRDMFLKKSQLWFLPLMPPLKPLRCQYFLATENHLNVEMLKKKEQGENISPFRFWGGILISKDIPLLPGDHPGGQANPPKLLSQSARAFELWSPGCTSYSSAKFSSLNWLLFPWRSYFWLNLAFSILQIKVLSLLLICQQVVRIRLRSNCLNSSVPSR